MKHSIAVLILGGLLTTGVSSYASAAYWEHIPPRLRVGQYQNAAPDFNSARGGLTTGAVNGAPGHQVPGGPRKLRPLPQR